MRSCGSFPEMPFTLRGRVRHSARMRIRQDIAVPVNVGVLLFSLSFGWSFFFLPRFIFCFSFLMLLPLCHPVKGKGDEKHPRLKGTKGN